VYLDVLVGVQCFAEKKLGPATTFHGTSFMTQNLNEVEY